MGTKKKLAIARRELRDLQEDYDGLLAENEVYHEQLSLSYATIVATQATVAELQLQVDRLLPE